jgi:hypothetical protein
MSYVISSDVYLSVCSFELREIVELIFWKSESVPGSVTLVEVVALEPENVMAFGLWGRDRASGKPACKSKTA